MTDWQNKVALVTGGSAGLGLAIARAFHQRGANVVIAGRDPDRLARAVADVSTPGRACVGIVADVTRDADVERLIAETAEKFGRLDVLVNCAGRSARGEAAATTPAEFTALLEANFLSAVRCTRAALPYLQANEGGHLVYIGSLSSKTASKYLGAYPASKFSLAAYAQQLRLELGKAGPHVLLVCPGPIRRDDAGQRYAAEAQHLPEQAKRPGGGARLKGIDPQWLAQRIVRACERREIELVVPGYVRWLFAIGAISPKWGDAILTRWTK
jgi:NAD(P)-dependent dehydrogenase (short-subunit alcohol dehydrogenase family)